jgi:cell division control protein 6
LPSAIFRNRRILLPRYIPENLVHREDKLELLSSLFADAAESPSNSYLQVVQLIGPRGSGKTSVMRVFGRSLEQEGDRASQKIKHIYINLKEHGGSRITLFRYLLELVASGSHSIGLSAEEVLTQFLDYLRSRKIYVLMSFDEIDSWLKTTKDTSIIYDLTRLNESTPDGVCNVLGIMFAARSIEFQKKLEDAELSTLGEIPIFFNPYTRKEIRDILSDRAVSAFQPKAINPELLDFVSDAATTSPRNGDARYALDLLRYAGSYAEKQGADSVTPEHVRYVVNQMSPSFTQDDIATLPSLEHVLALLSVVLCLRGTKETFCSYRDIRAQAELLANSRKSETLVVRLDDLLQDLVDKRIVQMRSFREIGILAVPVDRLFQFLDATFQKMNSNN